MNTGHPVQTELVTRLRRTSSVLVSRGTGVFKPEPINPDGPEAADEIERLASSERRLREALTHLCDSIQAENANGVGVSGLLMSDMREGLAALTHKEEQRDD